jgi:hypothetical protein
MFCAGIIKSEQMTKLVNFFKLHSGMAVLTYFTIFEQPIHNEVYITFTDRLLSPSVIYGWRPVL